MLPGVSYYSYTIEAFVCFPGTIPSKSFLPGFVDIATFPTVFEFSLLNFSMSAPVFAIAIPKYILAEVLGTLLPWNTFLSSE